ncbi:MAG: hypothetical protein IPP29_22165 [Bacteroidetes bacterium]|nr:hypothetical protein [Bacteroidota bacterium]
MKNIILLILFITFYATNLYAQNPLVKQWDKRFGGTGDDELSSLQQTTDGGYILAGYSASGIGGDKTQPSWGNYDYWIVKMIRLVLNNGINDLVERVMIGFIPCNKQPMEDIFWVVGLNPE